MAHGQILKKCYHGFISNNSFLQLNSRELNKIMEEEPRQKANIEQAESMIQEIERVLVKMREDLISLQERIELFEELKKRAEKQLEDLKNQ